MQLFLEILFTSQVGDKEVATEVDKGPILPREIIAEGKSRTGCLCAGNGRLYPRAPIGLYRG